MNSLISKRDLTAIVVVAIILIPVVAWIAGPMLTGHTVASKTQCLSNQKQIATAIIIYAIDNDETFPLASSMLTLRAQLNSYVKRKESFLPYKKYTTIPQFNFNLAGVKNTLPPFPGTEQREPNEVAIWYSAVVAAPYGFLVAHADSSVKFYPAAKHAEYQNLLAPQFDRKGIQLLPPDYLADQDPLKENK
ncbi:MAG: hypothetical protein KF836_09330 [Fimbriimonadaceae bacterium]|nr:hypothetical protein [Fimbriimonadaceae bacterium]